MRDAIKYSLVVPIFQDADLIDDFTSEFHTVFSKFLN